MAIWSKVYWYRMGGLTKSEKLEPWYAGAMNRIEAEQALAGTPNGTFLIRESDIRVGQYDLSASVALHKPKKWFMGSALPGWLGGSGNEPPPPPEVRHMAVFMRSAGGGKNKTKKLFSLAKTERRKWWSMQQLVDFYGTDSLERNFVGMKANLSLPYKHADRTRRKQRGLLNKPLLSTLPDYSAESSGSCMPPAFSAAVLCTIAFYWQLDYTGRGRNTWKWYCRWLRASTGVGEAAAQSIAIAIAVFVAVITAYIWRKMSRQGEGTRHRGAVADFVAEQAAVQSVNLTWRDMANEGRGMQSSEANFEYSNSEGTSDDKDAFDRPNHVIYKTGGATC